MQKLPDSSNACHARRRKEMPRVTHLLSRNLRKCLQREMSSSRVPDRDYQPRNIYKENLKKNYGGDMILYTHLENKHLQYPCTSVEAP